MGENAGNVFDWMKQEELSAGSGYKSKFDLKYKKGDVVRFKFFEDKDPLEGMIEIIDQYGTFDQSDEPSYDIYKFDNNTLYKHVRQSLVTEFVRSGSLDEIDKNIEKFK